MSKTYIQKGSDAYKDIFSVYGISMKSMPEMQLDVKDLFKRDWAENQGDEEYIPSALMFKGYETSIDFACVSTLGSAGALIRTFISYLASGEFSIYDQFSNRGFRCRFSGYNPVATYHVVKDAIVFQVKVKINNPLSYAVTGATTTSGAATIYYDSGSQTALTSAGSVSAPSLFAIISPQIL